MPMGLLDLSIITDHLIQMLRDAIAVPPNQIWSLEPTPAEGAPLGPPLEDPGVAFDITVTGNAPDVRGNSTGCLLSMYLFHIAPSPYQRNTPVTGDRTRAVPIPFQPLALELYYLLSAYAENRYIEEQQAMSIALKCFHEKPIVRNVTLASDGRPKGEFCLTMETESSDEIARLWQATTAAIRLSVVYKVSVVFIQPQDELPAAPKVQRAALAVAPTILPYADSGQVTAAFRHVRYFGPDDVRAAADLRAPDAVPSDEPGRSLSDYDALPAVVAPGESFLLYGAGFQPVPPQPIHLFLIQPNLPDQDVSSWIDATAIDNSDAKLHLKLPDPAGFPAGLYQLSVGLGANRTNATPFSIAARVDATSPSPVLTYAGTALTLNGAGFLAGKTQVVIDGTPLVENAAVGTGQFAVLGDAQLQFQPPAGLPPSRYGIRVRVNQVESAPAMWVRIP